MNDEKIGFVILNYKTWNETLDCVNSILASCQSSKLIVVVDNDSPNDSYLQLKKAFNKKVYNEVKLIKTEQNGGFSYGNNRGLEVIYDNNIKYCVITNNDVIFQERSISIMVDSFKQVNNAVVCAPAIMNTNLEITNLPWKKDQTLLQYLLLNREHLLFSVDELSDITKVYAVSGCCFCVDVNKFKEIQGFDENVFLYNEEYILAKKVESSRYSIFFIKNAKVIHNHGTTTGKNSIFIDKEILNSGFYYWKTYANKGTISLIFMYLIGNIRIVSKIILHKYEHLNGFSSCLKGTWKHLVNIIKTCNDV